MAHEGINKFIDHIAHMYRQEEDIHHRLTLLEVLMHYDDTVLSIGKFKCQRMYLKDTIKDINPGFYEEYFNRNRKKQRI